MEITEKTLIIHGFERIKCRGVICFVKNKSDKVGLTSKFGKWQICDLSTGVPLVGNAYITTIEEFEDMYGKKVENLIFELNAVESERARAFIREHANCPPRSMGEKIMFSFMPSTMGDLVRIYCCSCGVGKDITDTDKF